MRRKQSCHKLKNKTSGIKWEKSPYYSLQVCYCMYEQKFIDDTESLPHKQHSKHVKEKTAYMPNVIQKRILRLPLNKQFIG